MTSEQPLGIWTAVNLALRFVLELVGIGAFGYWGLTAGSGSALRFVLGVGAPVVLIIVWAFVVAPGATNPLSQLTRMALGTILLEVAAAALFVAGQSGLAVIFAAVVLANALAMALLGQ